MKKFILVMISCVVAMMCTMPIEVYAQAEKDESSTSSREISKMDDCKRSEDKTLVFRQDETPRTLNKMLLKKGNRLCKDGHFKQASAVCEQLFKGEADSTSIKEFYYLIGSVSWGLWKTGHKETSHSYILEKSEQFVNYFQNFIDTYPNSSYSEIAHKYIVKHLMESLQNEKTIQYLERVLRSSMRKEIKDKARVDIAYCYRVLKKYDKAKGLSKELLDSSDIDPDLKSRVRSNLYSIAIAKALKDTTTYGLSLRPKEHYLSKIILDIKFGDGPGEIKYIDNSSLKTGSSAFDVDEKGNIYILANHDQRIKIFDNNGSLIQSFPLADKCRSTDFISLDEGNNVWLHNIQNRIFRVYTSDGRLIKSIIYDVDISSAFEIRGCEIIGWASKIEVTGISKKSGIMDEPVYDAKIKMLDRNKPCLMNSCKLSKRLYNHVKRDFSPSNGLTKPKIEIIEDNSKKHELIFSDVSPLYSVSVRGEDAYGNVYFMLKYYGLKKPSQIFKYSPDLVLVAKIDNVPVPKGFRVMKELVIDQKGNIYFMDMDIYMYGVHIIKWYLEK